MNWPYLKESIFCRRYENLSPYFFSDHILEIGNNTSTALDFFKNKTLYTIDPLDQDGTLSTSWQHTKATIGQVDGTPIAIFLSSLEYDLIALGLDIAPLGTTIEQTLNELKVFLSFVSRAKSVALEYSLNHWSSKLLSEYVISHLSEIILLNKDTDYNKVLNGVPSFATPRRMVIFKPKLNIDVDALVKKFIPLKFPSLLSTLEVSNMKDCLFCIDSLHIELCQKKFLFKKIRSFCTVFSKACPWNYITCIRTSHSRVVAFELQFILSFKDVYISLSKIGSAGFYAERNISSIADKRIKVILKPDEQIIIRYGQVGGSNLMLFKVNPLQNI